MKKKIAYKMKNKRALVRPLLPSMSHGSSVNTNKKAYHTSRVTNVGHLHLVVKGGIAEYPRVHPHHPKATSISISPNNFTSTFWSFIFATVANAFDQRVSF